MHSTFHCGGKRPAEPGAIDLNFPDILTYILTFTDSHMFTNYRTLGNRIDVRVQ
jgi:hypothetical protein